jgi:hypothetical protein
MHTFGTEDIDGSGEGRRDRWDEDGEAAVLELFDDEGRDERLSISTSAGFQVPLGPPRRVAAVRLRKSA